METCRLIPKNVAWSLRRWHDARFDRRHGTDTTGRLDLDRLSIGSPNKSHGVYYEPTPRRTFHRIMRHLPRALEAYAFVDYGCGKGRVLLLAAPYRFRRVVGVEFSQELCAVARRNVEAYARATGRTWPIEVVCGDAAEFAIPDGPCVLYFYNPFDRVLMKRIAERVRDSWERDRRKMYVAYYNAQSAEAFEALGIFRVCATGSSRFDFATAIKRPYRVYESA